MKIGYRDTQHAGAHQVRLGGVLVAFDAKGIAWNPPPEAQAHGGKGRGWKRSRHAWKFRPA